MTRFLSVLRKAWAVTLVGLRVVSGATVLSTLVELVGLAVLVYGVGLIYRPAGFILAGLFLVLVGVAMDPPLPRSSAGSREQ